MLELLAISFIWVYVTAWSLLIATLCVVAFVSFMLMTRV